MKDCTTVRLSLLRCFLSGACLASNDSNTKAAFSHAMNEIEEMLKEELEKEND